MKRFAALLPDGWLARSLWIVGAPAYVVYVSSLGGEGTDFGWVHQGTKAFLEGGDPYDVELFVNPPSALLLLAPLGLDSAVTARDLFVPVNSLAIAAAAVVTVAALGFRWIGIVSGAVLVALAGMPAVGLTVALGNVNGLVVLCQALSLLATVRGRWGLAGVLLGLSLAIKPILVPLLIPFLLLRQWRGALLAVAVPSVLSLVAIALNTAALEFFTEALPFLARGNHPALQETNVTLVGVADTLDLPRALGQLARFVVLAAAVALAWRRWRTREADEAGERLRLVEATGVLLIASFLCFSFSWEYYGLYLLPLAVSIACPGSLLRHPAAVAGLFVMFTPVELSLDRFADASRDFELVRPALSWLLILAGMALVMRRARTAAL